MSDFNVVAFPFSATQEGRKALDAASTMVTDALSAPVQTRRATAAAEMVVGYADWVIQRSGDGKSGLRLVPAELFLKAASFQAFSSSFVSDNTLRTVFDGDWYYDIHIDLELSESMRANIVRCLDAEQALNQQQFDREVDALANSLRDRLPLPSLD
ncbi:hypothetical protein A3709_19225 [Halioglobus sp. HI00S01]|uniref:hypothetical protein n=1 Tax=Halioglobus sp. HI00S01 TaxID=1822214 RepID=UPI0007C35839|nr:hypothetical protein [Halioglobus sp. HI00S01]KZX57756.1 hypothetical protein A3709_19225 [Halioglobus sp. HI00S01]